MDKIIINIKAIYPFKSGLNGPRRGVEMQELESIEKGYISINNERIKGIGLMEDLKLKELPTSTEVIDAYGQFALPCFASTPNFHIHVTARA
jgi:imidazolonepropionase